MVEQMAHGDVLGNDGINRCLRGLDEYAQSLWGMAKVLTIVQ